MRNALIGYTGFVGGNLKAQGTFDFFYNSKNYRMMSGKEFDAVWCSGISAVKWLANQNPERDWQRISSLLDVLATVRAKHFVLISTVDVFINCNGATESTPVETENLHPYGVHRYRVEQFVADRFSSHTIVRLPGLFGAGLKKNIIYDFLHENELHKIHSENIFQFYSLDTVYADIQTSVRNNLKTINLATEPVSVKDVARHGFGFEFNNKPNHNPVFYDMHTNHATMYGASGNYIKSARHVLDDIKYFVSRTRA